MKCGFRTQGGLFKTNHFFILIPAGVLAQLEGELRKKMRFL
jgi:hypothetical protein